MDDPQMRQLLEETRTIAVVGLSDRPERPSYGVARYLLAQGYQIFPVNPAIDEFLGLESYPDLSSVPQPIDVVDIFRQPQHVPPIVQEAIEVGAKAIWMQLGVMHAEAAALAEAAGLSVVMNRCMSIEHQRLNIGPIDADAPNEQ